MAVFYSVSGSKQKVTREQLERKRRRQRAQVERHGNRLWITRRGRALSVSPERYEALLKLREKGKAAAEKGKITRARGQETNVRKYPGPKFEISNPEDERQMVSRLFDLVPTVIKADGRKGDLQIEIEMASSWEDDGETVEGTTQTAVIAFATDGVAFLNRSWIRSQLQTSYVGAPGWATRYQQRQALSAESPEATKIEGVTPDAVTPEVDISKLKQVNIRTEFIVRPVV